MDLFPRSVPHRRPAGAQTGHISVFQVDDLPGIGQKGGNVRGTKGFPFPQPQHQRRSPPHTEKMVRILTVHDGQGKGSLEASLEFP